LIPATAREAERAYAALAGELRRPRGTIDLVLYDNVDFPNGFANVIPSNRIAVFLTPPAGEIGLARHDDWMRLVITHELTHIFHLDRADGVWGVFQHVFGRAPLLFPNTYRPGWVVEGLATYYESALTAGGRVRGAFHSQLLTAAARSGSWPVPGEANFTNARWPAAAAPYAWGSRFFAWEAATHGDTVIPINLHEREIEGLKAYRSVLDVPGSIDMASFYVPPDIGELVIEDVARKGIAEVWLNPGAESDALIARARALHLEPIVACSIVGIGQNPYAL